MTISDEIDMRGGADRGPCPHAWGERFHGRATCLICGDREPVVGRDGYDVQTGRAVTVEVYEPGPGLCDIRVREHETGRVYWTALHALRSTP